MDHSWQKSSYKGKNCGLEAADKNTQRRQTMFKNSHKKAKYQNEKIK